MQIITSKTDQAIRNEFGRRGFLKLVGSAGFGVIVYSELGPISLAVGPSNMKPASGWKNFFAGFAEFALNVGMVYLGSQLSEWLSKYPRWDNVVRNLARGINSPYIPYDDYNLQGDRRTIFFPMYNQQNGKTLSPFYDRNNLSLSSEISMFTGLALPEVNRALVTQGDNKKVRAAFLIPRGGGDNSYNNLALPESYGTDAGSAEFRFKGNERGGNVYWTVSAKSQGSLEQPYKNGKVGVSFYG